MKAVRVIVQPLLVGIVLALAARAAVHLYSIPSPSMAPTLRAGDHILVTPYHLALPGRGDIVVFRSPADHRELLVKRIVAIPGDLVDSREGRLMIGGHTIGEAYLLRQATTGAIPSQIIPADSYFVLGDNRVNSFDSRSFGILPRALIVGRARLILWSSGGGASSTQASAAAISDTDGGVASFRFGRLFRLIE